ncbi:MAG: lipoyl synthase [Microthrixaceae bacterium]
MAPLHVRWLGRTRYRDALALQQALSRRGRDNWLLCQEHEPTYTMGVRTDPANLLVDPAEVGAELVRADRGGDVTFHGPGQLTAYPILTLAGRGGGDMPDSVAYVRAVEQTVMDTLADLGLAHATRLDDYPGVWVAPPGERPRKIAAIGVRLARNRTLHGVALNVDVDLDWFNHIVPCGIAEYGVTSLAAEGIGASMAEVTDAFTARAVSRWAPAGGARGERADGLVAVPGAAAGSPDGFGAGWDRSDVVWRHRPDDLAPFSRREASQDGALRGPAIAAVPADGAAPSSGSAPSQASTSEAPANGSVARVELTPRRARRLADAGVESARPYRERKPEWMRAAVRHGPAVASVKRAMASHDLVTVCEEAGCPNLSECWAEGTATFMINGERCTRACGFCLVDTRLPGPLDASEPQRVARAVDELRLDFAVVTAVARDDLADGGAGAFAATIAAIRSACPGCRVEVLIPDCKGDPEALATIFDARPDVLNHNIETVARLQRAARPSAGYARSLAVLARAADAGLVTKSGMVLGMGETEAEIASTLADLAGVGVSIVTMGQYLRPTAAHLPVARWWTPEDFERFAGMAAAVGISHAESSPFTRSSHHAAQAADSVADSAAPALR